MPENISSDIPCCMAMRPPLATVIPVIKNSESVTLQPHAVTIQIQKRFRVFSCNPSIHIYANKSTIVLSCVQYSKLGAKICALHLYCTVLTYGSRGNYNICIISYSQACMVHADSGQRN